MGTAIAMRRDYSSRELRRLATRVKEAAQARRLLAIAAVLDGSSREEAAKIGGMDRQTLRDWVIRFNEEGPDSLVNKSSPGAPGKLTEEHKAFLVRLVEEGPIPAADSAVRSPRSPARPPSPHPRACTTASCSTPPAPPPQRAPPGPSPT